MLAKEISTAFEAFQRGGVNQITGGLINAIYLIETDKVEKNTDGYLSETAERLNDAEIENLAFAAKLMTFECGSNEI